MRRVYRPSPSTLAVGGSGQRRDHRPGGGAFAADRCAASSAALDPARARLSVRGVAVGALRPIVAWIVELIAWDRLKARLAAAIEHLPPIRPCWSFSSPSSCCSRSSCSACGCWRTAHGSAPWRFLRRQSDQHGRHRLHLRRDAPEAAAARLVPRLYEHILVWLAWAHAIIDPIKARMRAAIAQAMRRSSAACGLVWLMRPGRAAASFAGSRG